MHQLSCHHLRRVPTCSAGWCVQCDLPTMCSCGPAPLYQFRLRLQLQGAAGELHRAHHLMRPSSRMLTCFGSFSSAALIRTGCRRCIEQCAACSPLNCVPFGEHVMSMYGHVLFKVTVFVYQNLRFEDPLALVCYGLLLDRRSTSRRLVGYCSR